MPGSAREFWRAAGCPHERFADDGHDAFGDRVCARCETKVRVVLTEAAFKTTVNMLATRERFPRPFPEID